MPCRGKAWIKFRRDATKSTDCFRFTSKMRYYINCNAYRNDENGEQQSLRLHLLLKIMVYRKVTVKLNLFAN